MNRVYSVYTYYLEEALKNMIQLEIVKPPQKEITSLEMELACRGYGSMENKLKHYLVKQQAKKEGKSPEEITTLEMAPEDAYRVIKEVRNICVSRTGEEDDSAVADVVERHICSSFETSEHTTVFFFPSQDTGTNDLMSVAYDLLDKEFEDTNVKDSKRKHLETLLTQRKRKHDSVRKDLIRAAYRLGMNLREANEFLTKAALTSGLDYTDPWDRKAAYLIACEPAGEDDSALIFRDKMEKAVPTEQFWNQVCRMEFMNWVADYRQQDTPEKKEAFLLNWAWKLLAHEDPMYGKKSTYTKISPARKRQIDERFSMCFTRLHTLADTIDSSKSIPPTDLLIAACRMDRRRHLLEYLYEVTSDSDVQDVTLYGPKGQPFWPCFKEYGFTKLDRNLRKVADPDRPVTRSDIIKLGLMLELSWEQIDRALQLGGFYKLYAKDFHEQALLAVLAKKPASAEETKAKILQQIQHDYSRLSEKLREKMKKEEPEWVRGLKNADGAD